MSDLRSQLLAPDATVTVGWLEDHLKEYNKVADDNHITKFTGKRIAMDSGFFSYIFKIGLAWSKEDDRLPTAIVLKFPNPETFQKMSEEFSMEKKTDTSWVSAQHNLECRFYNMWKDVDCPVKEIPKCYLTIMAGGDEVAALGLEDLSETGIVPSFVKGLNLKQVLNAVEVAAKIHGWSTNHMELINNNFGSDRIPKDKCDSMLQLWKKGMTKLKNDFEELNTPLMDEMIGWNDDGNSFYYMYSAHKQLNINPVFVHMDIWPNNMMYEREAGDKVGDKLRAYLDWQLCHPGLFIEDIVRYIFGLAQLDVRRDHLEDVFKHYYETLKTACAPNKPPFEYEDIHRAYRYLTRWGVMFNFATVGMIYSKAGFPDKDAPEVKDLMKRLRASLEDSIEVMRSEKIVCHPLNEKQ